jgi:hypothetical protein
LRQVVVDEHYVIRVPDAIDLAKAAPLLCAGISLAICHPNGPHQHVPADSQISILLVSFQLSAIQTAGVPAELQSQNSFC